MTVHLSESDILPFNFHLLHMGSFYKATEVQKGLAFFCPMVNCFYAHVLDVVFTIGPLGAIITRQAVLIWRRD